MFAVYVPSVLTNHDDAWSHVMILESVCGKRFFARPIFDAQFSVAPTLAYTAGRRPVGNCQ